MGRATAARPGLRYGGPEGLQRRPAATLLPRPAARLVLQRPQWEHAGQDQPGLAAPPFQRARSHASNRASGAGPRARTPLRLPPAGRPVAFLDRYLPRLRG